MSVAAQIAAERLYVFRYARKLMRSVPDAEDLTQRVMLRALSRSSQFTPQPGSSLRNWLMVICHNEYVNLIRHMARTTANDLELHEEILVPEERGFQVPAGAYARLRFTDFVRLLQQVPAIYSEAVLMVGYDGLTYRQVARCLGVPVGTVRSRLSRGREILRGLLDDISFHPRRKDQANGTTDESSAGRIQGGGAEPADPHRARQRGRAQGHDREGAQRNLSARQGD